MRINRLKLKNIGPFLDAELDFDGSNKNAAITLITGENGTGKSIVIDAIRKMILGSHLGSFSNERDICRGDNFQVEMGIDVNGLSYDFIAQKKQKTGNNAFSVNYKDEGLKNSGFNPKHLHDYFFGSLNVKPKPNWIVNYWTSQNDNLKFNIDNIKFFESKNYLLNSLDGIQKNSEVVSLITYFDYLRTSTEIKEREEGEFLFNTLKKIIELSLNEGEFKHVERKTLMPIVRQKGADVSIDKLSSGNLYLIQRMVALLGQMYAVYSINNLKLEDMLKSPGLLLIDEAENHLHPKWQKTFLNSVLSIFPNLQIIATTHSPFIISSVENARVYVCKSKGDYAIIEDETDVYSNKPIDEILVSDVFDTQPFNEKISALIEAHQVAKENRDLELSEKIEKQLVKLNPQHFSYFEIDNLLKSFSK